MNKKTLSPSDIARETLRRLALQRKPPTPGNFRLLYQEIEGAGNIEDVPVRAIKSLLDRLPRHNPDQTELVRTLQNAVASGSWENLSQALADYLDRDSANHNWPSLFRELLTQYEQDHAGMTRASKRSEIDAILTGTSTTNDSAYPRLQALAQSWANHAKSGTAGLTTAVTTAKPDHHDNAVATIDANMAPLVSPLREFTARLLESGIAQLLSTQSELHSKAHSLAADLRNAQTPQAMHDLLSDLQEYMRKLRFAAEEEQELKIAHQQVITLIFDNIKTLVAEDQWIAGQVSLVRDLLTEPLSLRRADDIERRMKDVLVRQDAISQHLKHAKVQMKELLATFVARLGSFASATSGYHDKIANCAERIGTANDIEELSEVIAEAMRETRTIQLSAASSRDDLDAMRAQASEAEKEIARLQQELAKASDKVRTDPLTGLLNRRGLDEQILREVARAKRHGSELCFALLDIDNFKTINDELGHAAGDTALVHLANVIQESIRPIDTLARYGGEEFVVMLPQTSIDDAVSTMVRVQRDLTRRFFMNEQKKVLITFSCGVTRFNMNEDPSETINRADKAMYLAKRSGKNRVISS